jgi:alpha-tubulin suppressor-like RCC1 family protein
VDVAAGNVYKPEGVPHILALRRNGSVSGWGRNTLGQALGAPTGVNFKAIAAGVDFSIGLDEHGLIHHWGDPGPQIGLTSAGSPICELSPVPEGRFRAIGAGSHHAAAVQAPGTGSP